MGFRNVVIVGMIAVWKLDMYRCVGDQEYLVEVPLYKEQSGVKSLYANPYLIAYSSIGRPASIQANKVHCGASLSNVCQEQHTCIVRPWQNCSTNVWRALRHTCHMVALPPSYNMVKIKSVSVR